MSFVATVKIVSTETAEGYMIINADDFDGATMTLVDPAIVSPTPKKKAQA